MMKKKNICKIHLHKGYFTFFCILLSFQTAAQSFSNNPNVFIKDETIIIENNSKEDVGPYSSHEKNKMYVTKETAVFNFENKTTIKLVYIDKKKHSADKNTQKRKKKIKETKKIKLLKENNIYKLSNSEDLFTLLATKSKLIYSTNHTHKVFILPLIRFFIKELFYSQNRNSFSINNSKNFKYHYSHNIRPPPKYLFDNIKFHLFDR